MFRGVFHIPCPIEAIHGKSHGFFVFFLRWLPTRQIGPKHMPRYSTLTRTLFPFFELRTSTHYFVGPRFSHFNVQALSSASADVRVAAVSIITCECDSKACVRYVPLCAISILKRSLSPFSFLARSSSPLISNQPVLSRPGLDPDFVCLWNKEEQVACLQLSCVAILEHSTSQSACDTFLPWTCVVEDNHEHFCRLARKAALSAYLGATILCSN